MSTPVANSNKPTLCLAMIVRSESEVLARCLASVRPFINSWCIFDTGSTDNTAEIIEQALAGIPGQLSQEPFSDFALIRNKLLALAAERADYVMMLDADEELLSLREQILPHADFDVARIEIRQENYSILQHRLFRSGFDIQFQGTVCERVLLPRDSRTIDLETSMIVHHQDGYRSQQAFRSRNDIAYLNNEIRSLPDTSVRLALARLYIENQENEKGNAQLDLIIQDHHALVGDRWMAYYMLGLQYKGADQHEEALKAFLNAYDVDPQRAEALYRLAEILGHQERWQDAYQLTQIAIELPRPGVDYFEPEIYDWWVQLLHASFCIELELYDEAHKTVEVLTRIRLSKDAREYRGKLRRALASQNSLELAHKPRKTTTRKKPKLTIGMATYDDFDGVYFTIASILSGHPEIRDQIEIIVLDNNPSGASAKALKKLCAKVTEARYVANEEVRGTCIRTHLFDYARAEAVLCIDCHVVILPGAIGKLIDYFEAHPDTGDLLHGPMISDNLDSVLTHMEPRWHAGMFGYWSDKKQDMDIGDKPFEIQIQGMGLYACRKDAWPGYNPRFKGFGGEEGYIHEKFRQKGHRVLCLPFLCWMHRFARPTGVPYSFSWSDWIRNYLIGFDELGLDTQALEAHYAEYIGFENMARTRADYEAEKQNPFFFFDAIYCIDSRHQTERWEAIQTQAEKLGFAHRLRRFSAIETPGDQSIKSALSHRTILLTAKNQGFKNVLILEDDAIFRINALALLKTNLQELRNRHWDLFYIGGSGEQIESSHSSECDPLYEVGAKSAAKQAPARSRVIAYHHHCYDYILQKLADNSEEMYVDARGRFLSIDQAFVNDEQLKRYASRFRIAN